MRWLVFNPRYTLLLALPCAIGRQCDLQPHPSLTVPDCSTARTSGDRRLPLCRPLVTRSASRASGGPRLRCATSTLARIPCPQMGQRSTAGLTRVGITALAALLPAPAPPLTPASTSAS